MSRIEDGWSAGITRDVLGQLVEAIEKNTDGPNWQHLAVVGFAPLRAALHRAWLAGRHHERERAAKVVRGASTWEEAASRIRSLGDE